MLIIKFKHHHYTKIKSVICDCIVYIDCKLMFVNNVIFIYDRTLMLVFRNNESEDLNLKTFILKSKLINLQKFLNRMTSKSCFIFKFEICRNVNEII